MILWDLSLRAFGRFRGEVRLEGLQPGLNILAGPNEWGKSTFFWALHHALFTPFSCKDQMVRALVPWGTELSPAVAVEFEHRGQRWLLQKAFLNGAGCTLLEWTGSRYEPKFEANRADEFMRSLLMGIKPGKGAAKGEHRGLARLLWVPQGQEALDSPTPGEAVRGKVQKVMGRVTTNVTEDAVLAQLRQWLAKTYTPGGKEAHAGSELYRLREELRAAASELELLQQALLTVEGYCQQLAEAQARLGRLQREKAETEHRVEGLAREAERIAQLKTELRMAQAELGACESRFASVDRDRAGLRAKDLRRQELAQRIETQRRVLASVQAQLRRAEQDLEQARHAEARARAVRDECKHGLAKVTKQRLLRHQVAEWERLRGQLQKVEGVVQALKEIQTRLEGIPEVSEKDRTRVAGIEREIQELEAQVRATGITLTLAFDPERLVTYVGSQGQGSVNAGPQQPVTLFTLDRLECRVTGVGSVHIESAASDARALDEEAHARRRELQTLLERYGARDRETLEAWVSLRRALQDDLKSQRRFLAEALQGFDTAAALRQALAVLEARLTQAREELSLSEEATRALDEPDDAGFKAELVHIEAALQGACASVTTAQAQVDGPQQRLRQLEEELIRLGADQQALLETREELLRRYGSPVELEQAYELARRERDAAESRVSAIQARLPEQARDPEAQLARHREALRKIDRELWDAADLTAGLTRLVEEKGGEGLYSRVVRQEEVVERLSAQVKRQASRARAIRLLHLLAEERQRRTAASLLTPLGTEASALWGAITQLPNRQVVFNEDLSIKGIRVNRDEYSLEPLSTGAREQLFLLTRLALARYLAQEERELFVIDDSLVNTDPNRLERFLAVLEQSASHLQIVLMTCHPERYRGLYGTAELRIVENL